MDDRSQTNEKALTYAQFVKMAQAVKIVSFMGVSGLNECRSINRKMGI
jgi:hypothetical protein